jgi:hypothetical protein
MLNTKRLAVVAGAAMVLFCIGAAQAVERDFQFSTSSLEAGRFMRYKDVQTAAPITITQNTDPNVVTAGSSVACANAGITTDNSAWRLFDLDDDHGITGTFFVQSLDFGEETVTEPQDVTLNAYCIGEGLPFFTIFLTFIDSTTVNLGPTDLSLHSGTFSGSGSCNADTEDLAIEIKTTDCLNDGTCLQNFIGANSSGQSAPSYISAEDCGLNDPTDTALIGFPNTHWVMTVHGDGEGGTTTTTTGAVPAVGQLGIVLMVLTLLVTGGYYMRRRQVAS